MKNFYANIFAQRLLIAIALFLTAGAASFAQTCNTPAPTAVSPVYYCQNATSSPLTATGTNLSWGTPVLVSGSVGGSSNLTEINWVDWEWNNDKTFFTTTEANVKITSIDYYIPAWQAVNGLQIAIFNSEGKVIAKSSTITTLNNAAGSWAKITNTFNYTIVSAGNYSIGLCAGSGNIGGDYPSLPITETTGAVNVTGYTQGTYRCFNNIQFSFNKQVPAPTPSTTTAGTTNYKVTQTVNGCVSAEATIAVIVTAPPSAAISYKGSPYCSSAGTAAVTLTGATGGTYKCTTLGSAINTANGAITLASAPAGTHTVTYTVAASGGCGTFTTTASVTITAAPAATISYGSAPYCSAGTAAVTRTGTAGGAYATTAGLSIDATTGLVNLASSTPGTYAVSYTIAASGGCAAFATSTTITITSPGVWTGAVSTDWNNAANWNCSILPSSTTDITIPSTTNLPVISAGTAQVKNITIQTGASVTVNAALEIAGTIINSGSIAAANGTVIMSGSSSQLIPAGLFAGNLVYNLVINNNAGVTLGGALSLANELNIKNGTLTTGGNLTLKSTETATASVVEIKSAAVSPVIGNVTVERYVPAKRAYRFLTAPVNTPGSIRANWMENTNNPTAAVNNNPVPGYGLHITGPGGNASGFDVTATNNASFYTYNNQTQAWITLPNTNSTFTAGSAYRVMVRGSRSTNLSLNAPEPTPTTLRATGTLISGTVTMTKPGGGGTAGMPALSAANNAYNLIGNPYASPIDWKKVKKKDIGKTLYYFDPTLEGSNGRGGYVSYNEVLDIVSNKASKANNYVQSGQAFFVQTTGSDPVITFDEKAKTNTQALVFRDAKTLPHLSLHLLLPTQKATDEAAADGLQAYFADDFSASVGEEDSYKFTNQDENIAILRSGTALSIEGRKTVTSNDTLPLKIWQLTLKDYTLKINAANFESNVSAYLEDAYLKSSTSLTNNAETLVPFSITSDAASTAADRFRIVFKSFSTLPVQLSDMKAYEKNTGIQVEWTALSESNMNSYEVEKSANGVSFVTAGSVKAKENSAPTSFYNWFDANPVNGDNYYRIKSIDKSGETKYTKIVKVRMESAAATITVSPAPSGKNSINLIFRNIEKADYAVNMINTAGQVLYTSSISHTGGSSNHVLNVKTPLPAGVYQVQLINGTTTKNVSVLIQ